MLLVIADPDPSFRAQLRAAIGEAHGVSAVIEAGTLQDLMRAVPEAGAGYLILSHELPGFRRGAVESLRRRAPSLGMIVLGDDNPDMLRAVLGEGAWGYVRRSDALEQCATALGTLRHGGVHIPPLLGLRKKHERLPSSAGPLPPGFFREEVERNLTPRQREILAMIRDGKGNADIARTLGVTVGTVKIHVTAIFKILGVRNRVQARVAAEYLALSKPL